MARCRFAFVFLCCCLPESYFYLPILDLSNLRPILPASCLCIGPVWQVLGEALSVSVTVTRSRSLVLSSERISFSGRIHSTYI